jgi:hypothetical protein
MLLAVDQAIVVMIGEAVGCRLVIRRFHFLDKCYEQIAMSRSIIVLFDLW